MNAQDFGAEFSALTEVEQAVAVGGDGYLARLVGTGAGVALGLLVRAVTTPWYGPALGYQR